MNKLSIAFLLTTFNITLFAQVKPYQPNPVPDKFIGTWVAQTGEKKITITIRKVQQPVLDSKFDILEGDVSYNGEVPDKSITPVLTSGFNYARSGKIFQDKVFFNFYDKIKKKRGRLTLILSDTNPDKFNVSLAEDRHFSINTSSTPARKVEPGFTLLTDSSFYKKL